MNTIELTEDHRSKLLEMCKELFPKNKVESLQFGTIKFLVNYYEKKDPNNSKITFGGWDEIVEIHWFEFCMIHLAKKVCKSDGITLTFKDDNNNVIEFLYEQFKKLKQ